MKVKTPVLREFPYRANRLQSAILLVLVACGSVIMGVLALYTDKAVNLKGIELSASQFRTLMGVFSVLSLLGLVAMGLMLVDSIVGTRRVALTVDSVILPRPSWTGMSKDEVELPFDEILVVQLAPFLGTTQMLQIVYDNGIISIPGNMMRRADFEEVGEHLYAVVAGREDGLDE